ncbi:MAG: hypothetical protein QM775_26190 [Pirellulales bacterium]
MVALLVCGAGGYLLSQSRTAGESPLLATARYHSRRRTDAFYYRSTNAYQNAGRLPKDMQRSLR